MLRAAIVLTLFLLIGLSGQAIYESSAYQKCSAEAGGQNSAEHEWQEKVVAFVSRSRIVFHCAGRSIADNNPVVSAIATVVIAVFTTVLGLFTMSLARSTRIAAEAAKKSADALPTIERAYIFIVPTIISSISMPKKGVSYYFVNHGKTPAIINGIERHFDPLTSPPDNTSFLANVLDANEVGIAAGERYPRDEQNAPLFETIQTANIGDPPAAFLWFYGTIVYSDVFGGTRHTRFRWRYNRATQEFCSCGGPPYNERT